MESLLWDAITDGLQKRTPIIKTFFHNMTQRGAVPCVFIKVGHGYKDFKYTTRG